MAGREGGRKGGIALFFKLILEREIKMTYYYKSIWLNGAG
jgi:hypothetical protein